MLQKLSFTFHHYQFIAKKNLSGLYPGCTCSVPSPLTGTSDRRKYGLGTEQVHPGYNADKTEPIGKGKIIIYAKRRKLTQVRPEWSLNKYFFSKKLGLGSI